MDRAKVGGRTSEDITTETPDETVGTIIIQRIVRGIRQPDIAIGRLGQQGDIPHDGTDGIGHVADLDRTAYDLGRAIEPTCHGLAYHSIHDATLHFFLAIRLTGEEAKVEDIPERRVRKGHVALELHRMIRHCRKG